MLQIHVNRLETIILKLVRKEPLDEAQQRIVDRIIDKRKK